MEAILVAWHERHVATHLEQLARLRDQTADPSRRLEAVLEAYAGITYERSRGRNAPDLIALVHRDAHQGAVKDRVHVFLCGVLAEGAKAGVVRADVAPDELAAYCQHALGAAGSLATKAAVGRLVGLTLQGLKPIQDPLPRSSG